MAAWSPQIANEFIGLANSDGNPLTQMQLQKLVFFAHGWTLAITGIRLTLDAPKAFEYGPVYESLWKSLTHHGRSPVKKQIKNGDYVPGIFEDDDDAPAIADLRRDERSIIERVYKDYGKFPAFQLSAITHEPGSPWEKIYAGGFGKYNEIPDDLIRDHFVRLAGK